MNYISFFNDYKLYELLEKKKKIEQNFISNRVTPFGNSLLNLLNHSLSIQKIFKEEAVFYIKSNLKNIDKKIFNKRMNTLKNNLKQLQLNNIIIDLIILDIMKKASSSNLETKTIRNCFLDLNLYLNSIGIYLSQKKLDFFIIPECYLQTVYFNIANNTFFNIESVINYKDKKFSIDNSKYKETLCISYKLENLNDFINAYIKQCIDSKKTIVKCKNCGTYFIPESRSDEKYCNNISPQNPNKTCKEYGTKKTYREKIKSNNLRKEHERTSQFFRMRIKRNKDKNNLKETVELKELFNQYKLEHEKKLKQYNNGKGNLSEEDFINWIIQQKHI